MKPLQRPEKQSYEYQNKPRETSRKTHKFHKKMMIFVGKLIYNENVFSGGSEFGSELIKITPFTIPITTWKEQTHSRCL